MRRFFQANRKVSDYLNRLLPDNLNVDGNKHFRTKTVPKMLQADIKLLDIGGGSQPCITQLEKDSHNIALVGLDISAEEMNAAPQGLYDETIIADLTIYKGQQDADVVSCQAVLEHVSDNRKAVAALASILKPGGQIYIFVPCRNALFARLNLALPQGVKEKLLEFIYPGIGEHQGFPVQYDNCTPKKLGALLEENGIEVVDIQVFWKSSYFTNFVPAFLLWRLWQGLAYLVIKEEAAETFIITGRKAI